MVDSTPDGKRIRPTALRVRYRAAPTNVPLDAPPRFSWRIDDASWGDGQSAYRIRLAAATDAADAVALEEPTVLWDSGRVDSSSSTDVGYDGPTLAPETTYHWQVRVWNDIGNASDWSEPATFSTAPDSGWAGDWIARQPGVGDSHGYRSRWRDPGEDPTEWVRVDLGDEKSFSAVELHPTEPYTGAETPDGRTITANDTEETYLEATVAQGPVAFGFPQRYRLEVADDPSFDDARVLVDASASDPGRDPVSHDIDATARYVRVVATDLAAYRPRDEQLRETFEAWAVFALAALVVRDDDGTDIAANRPVTASSSVDGEGWGTDHLTDGTLESVMRGQSPLFRTEIDLEKPVASATAHFVGLGYGELAVNGTTVGDDVLNPGWTQYDERVLYSTYDVGDLLEPGTNALGIWLGRGWFARSARHWNAVGSPRACLELTVEYADGTTRTVTTSGEWRTAPSPIVENDIYEGETYDARLELPGWAEPGFDDADWEPAAVVDAPDGARYPQQVDPITVTDTLEPVEILDHEDGPIVDFGQNHTGWLELEIEGGEPGDAVVLRHAEALDEDGGLRTVDLRSADATDTYIVGDEDAATYEPRSTYHGYRYAQISGYPGEFTADTVCSRVVHTGMDRTGTFACSNEDLTHVQKNAQWGLRSNAHSVPTDCPQRDERMGFTGDGHIAARALQYNFDAGRFHEKWLRDHADTQSRHGYVPDKCPYGALPSLADPSWTVSTIAIPWHLYQFEGNEGVLERNYESLRRYVEFWESVAEDDLLPDEYQGYGDWVALENLDGRRGLPRDFFTNAYYYRSVDLLSRIADALGVDGHAAHYRERASSIADAFNDRYFDAEAGAYESGTQATHALPVFFGIAPDDRVDEIVANLARKVSEEDDGQLRTGFLGTRPLLFVLAEYGYADLAYEVVSQPEFPGWVYMARQGATTVWERWDSDSEEHIGGRMNSLNHSPLTCISEWFFAVLAGIDVRFGRTDTDGVPIEIAPTFVDDLTWAEGSTATPRGPVRSRWDAVDGGHELRVELPWNCPARVALPLDDDATVLLQGEPVWTDGDVAADLPDAVDGVSVGDGEVLIDVSAGDHRFRLE